MQDAINIIRRIDDYCPICKKNYALELYNVYGNKLNYFRLINENNVDRLDKERNLTMKCRYCGTEFMIDRMDQSRYIPLIENSVKDNSYNKFLQGIENRKNKLYKKHRVIERKM